MSRTLIEHIELLTLDGDLAHLRRDVSIAIDGCTIAAVGETPPDFAADRDAGAATLEVIDGRGLLAMRGLYNAHCHAAMTLERGWAEDLPFPRWLNEKIWVAESALQEEDVYWGAALAACEMIRGGVIGFADHYFWMNQVARVVEESGMRALLAWCLFGLGPEREVGAATLEQTVAFCRSWQGAADGRIRTALGPHSPYMCPPEFLRSVAEAAQAIGVPVHLHLAESDEQVQQSLKRHGRAPVAHLAALGVLDGPTLAAHCIAVDDAEIALLAEHGVSVAHTPKTYLKLAMGVAPISRLLARGVTVALGSDGPASSGDLNLLEVLRLTGLVHKHELRDASALPIATLLRLATTAGAAALGFSTDALAPGAPADLILLDARGPHWCPRHDLAAGVVYASHPSDVRYVFVDGRLLLRCGELLTLDEERICYEAEHRALRMVGQPMSQLRSYRG
jgi:5-methylthioadenosine/S-adenosylhomocysteine deaminase